MQTQQRNSVKCVLFRPVGKVFTAFIKKVFWNTCPYSRLLVRPYSKVVKKSSSFQKVSQTNLFMRRRIFITTASKRSQLLISCKKQCWPIYILYMLHRIFYGILCDVNYACPFYISFFPHIIYIYIMRKIIIVYYILSCASKS